MKSFAEMPLNLWECVSKFLTLREQKLPERFNRVMKVFLIFLVVLSGCVPVGQGKIERQTQVTQHSPATLLETEALLTTILSISSLQVSFPVDETFLQGEEILLSSGYAKGTLRLLESMVLAVDNSYLVLPVEGNLVLGSGVYLLLLEKQGNAYTQTHDVYLGGGVYLFSLEYADKLITSVTIDPRTGKPPFNTSRGGKHIFEIKDGKLIEP